MNAEAAAPSPGSAAPPGNDPDRPCIFNDALHRTHLIAEGIKASAGVSEAFVHLSEPDPVSTADESPPVSFSRA